MSLKDRVLKGVLWTTTGSVLRLLFQLAVTSVVSRILSPADYGLIAMITSVHGVLIPLVTLQLDRALIREETLTPARLSTAFWLGNAMGVACTLLLAALAPVLAAFYARPELTRLGEVLALGFALSALGLVPQALLRRELRFRVLSQIDLASVVLSGLTALALAYAGFGVWALALQGLLGNVFSSLATWRVSRYWPARGVDRAFARSILRFGALSSAGDFAIMTCASLTQVIVGRALGPTDFGLYARAVGLAQLAVSTVNNATAPVILPALSQLQQEPARLGSVCLRATSVSMLVLAPALAAFIAVPDVVLALLYGASWTGAAEPLRVMAAPILLFGTLNAISAVFQVTGRTDLTLRWSAISGIALLLGSWIGSLWGTPTSAALGYVPLLFLILPRVAAAGQLIGLSVASYVRALQGPLLAALATGVVVALTRHALPPQPIWTLAPILCGVGGLTYAALTAGLRIEAFTNLRNFVGR